MSTVEKLFHGTSRDIVKFKPFSHFGNKDVALDAIARKVVDDGQKKAILISVNLHVSEEQLLELEDWGTPNSQGLASALKWASKGQEREQLQEILNGISSEKEDNNPLWNENGFEKLTEILKAQNIAILKYPNDVEGREESYSFCVLNSDTVEIVSQESVEINQLVERVEKWKSFNARYKRS